MENIERILKEGWIKCPFCPCWFATETDFNKHMDAFGWVQKDHLEKYATIQRRFIKEYPKEQRQSWKNLYEKSKKQQ